MHKNNCHPSGWVRQKKQKKQKKQSCHPGVYVSRKREKLVENLKENFLSNFHQIESSSNALRAPHTVLRTTIALKSLRAKGFKH